MKKFFSLLITISCLAAVLVACTGSNQTKEDTLATIKLGVTSAPHGVIVEALKDDFKKEGLNVETFVVDDYTQLNHALADKSLDANYFQHKPFFDNFTKEHNLDLEILGYVHLEPMGFYSSKYKSISEIKDGDEILIPNDVSNGARALFLLEEAGLIELARHDFDISIKDIKSNKKNLKITALTASTLPSAYVDVAGGVINSNFVISSGMDIKSALISEKTENNPYANLVAVRKGDASKAEFVKLLNILQSEKAKNFINSEYNSAVVPAK